MITDIARRAPTVRWTWLFVLPALIGAVSIALPWFHPVLLGGLAGPDDLGARYLSAKRDVWIVLFAVLLVGLGWTLATGQQVRTSRPVRYVSALVVASGVVFEVIAYLAWTEQHDDDASAYGLTRQIAVQPGFYLIVAAGGLAIVMGLVLLAQAVRTGT